jgi:cellulose synthase/poly-beta-1,6-N-acetylglucosamine synthase-like glycosyltransferase
MTAHVAILTPVYQHAHYLPEMLRSLIVQSFTDWECAVVFDGPDPQYDEIRSLFQCEPRIKFHLLPEHRGLPVARNTCTSLTSSEWVLPFDADDLMDFDYLETLEQSARRENFLDGRFHAYFTPARLLFETGRTEEYVYPRFVREQIADQVFLPGCSMFKRRGYMQYGGLDPAWNLGATDWMLWVRMAANNDLVPVQTATAKWTYRQHDGFRAHHEGVRQLHRLRPEMLRALRGERRYGEAIP